MSPVTRLGQLITFATEIDDDQRYASYIWIVPKKGDTVAKIASRRGHPEQARDIADLNNIRSVRSVIKLKRLKVPGTLRKADAFDVLAGDSPPRIVAGYAKLDIVDRPLRVGLSQFRGYDPIGMEVPIRFENFAAGEGAAIETDIRLLERMAGRGNFTGAAVGPPPVIRVSTTNSRGDTVPLVPSNYQWSAQNPSAPLWRIADIAWGDAVPSDVVRNQAGNRVRQTAVVTLQQRVRVGLATRSSAARAKAKKPKPKKPKR